MYHSLLSVLFQCVTRKIQASFAVMTLLKNSGFSSMYLKKSFEMALFVFIREHFWDGGQTSTIT